MLEWINVEKQVPDDRRKVFVWGFGGIFGVKLNKTTGQYLGTTSFNPSKTGGRFDIEKPGYYTFCKVTHWAEIEGPDRV